MIEKLVAAIVRGDLKEVIELTTDKEVLYAHCFDSKETPVLMAIKVMLKQPKPERLNIIDHVLSKIGELPPKQRQKVVNATDANGFTALHWAVQIGMIDVVDSLLKLGADHTARTPKGVTVRTMLQVYHPQKLVKFDDLVRSKLEMEERGQVNQSKEAKSSAAVPSLSELAPLLSEELRSDAVGQAARKRGHTAPSSSSALSTGSAEASSSGSVSNSASDSLSRDEEQALAAIQSHLKLN